MVINHVHIGHRITLTVVAYVLTVIFCITLYSLLKPIPEKKRSFPLYFIWLSLIPDIGYIFQCIIMPFAIPKTLRNAFPNHQEAMLLADKLVKYGVWYIIFIALGYVIGSLHMHIPTDVVIILSVIFWLLYWLTAMKFRRERQRFIDETKD